MAVKKVALGSRWTSVTGVGERLRQPAGRVAVPGHLGHAHPRRRPAAGLTAVASFYLPSGVDHGERETQLRAALGGIPFLTPSTSSP